MIKGENGGNGGLHGMGSTDFRDQHQGHGHGTVAGAGLYTAEHGIPAPPAGAGVNCTLSVGS